jgi:hypothetical protein
VWLDRRLGKVARLTTVVVSGAIANKPFKGGEAWVRLSWALGLKKLGFDVYFVEQIDRDSCVDADGAVVGFEHCVNLAYFKQITEQFGLSDTAALISDNGEQVHGLAYPELLERAEAADLLVNISGHLALEPLTRRLRCKVYLDIDPGFTQFWHAAGNAGPRLEGHDFYFTIGENIGSSFCYIPTSDIRWRRTRQPVVLEHWPVSDEGSLNRFTTVASWRGPYGPVQHGDKTLGLKVHEFRKFIHLPERVRQEFEIALDIHPADEKDLKLLRHHGWHIVDPLAFAADPSTFREYVQTSGAEFSVAQGVYVETESGWFSDRTVRYLASGKPVLVQDTGFSHNYPVGKGLIAFRTMEQAISGAEQIMVDYDRHCRSSRTLAETYFDSDKVLSDLIAEVGIAP